MAARLKTSTTIIAARKSLSSQFKRMDTRIFSREFPQKENKKRADDPDRADNNSVDNVVNNGFLVWLEPPTGCYCCGTYSNYWGEVKTFFNANPINYI